MGVRTLAVPHTLLAFLTFQKLLIGSRQLPCPLSGDPIPAHTVTSPLLLSREGKTDFRGCIQAGHFLPVTPLCLAPPQQLFTGHDSCLPAS